MKAPKRPTQLRGRIFRGSDRVLTRAELRSGAWLRVHRDSYADAELDSTHALRCASACALSPAEAAVGGRSAAWLWGVRLLDDDAPVELILPPDQRFGPVAGVQIRTTPLPPADVVAGMPRLTTPDRTAWDIARFHPVPEALAYLDAMVAQRIVTVPELQKRLRECRTRWGRKRAATAIGLIEPRSESPQESRLRGLFALAGLPLPVVQHSIYAGGRFVARVDFAWPAAKLAVEYDGAWHASAAQLHTDRKRLNRLVAAGWTVLHVTSVQMTHPPSVLAEVRAALARA